MLKQFLWRCCGMLAAILPLGACMSNPSQTLIDAVFHEDERSVRRLIAAGAPLEQPDEDGQTPLVLAAKTDQFVLANILLDAGANPMAASKFGWTAPYAAHSSQLAGGPEFAAREAFIAKLRQRGITFPPPRPAQVRAAMAGEPQ